MFRVCRGFQLFSRHNIHIRNVSQALSCFPVKINPRSSKLLGFPAVLCEFVTESRRFPAIMRGNRHSLQLFTRYDLLRSSSFPTGVVLGSKLCRTYNALLWLIAICGTYRVKRNDRHFFAFLAIKL